MKPGNPRRRGGRGGEEGREGRMDGRGANVRAVMAIMKLVNMAWNVCIIGNPGEAGNHAGISFRLSSKLFLPFV